MPVFENCPELIKRILGRGRRGVAEHFEQGSRRLGSDLATQKKTLPVQAGRNGADSHGGDGRSENANALAKTLKGHGCFRHFPCIIQKIIRRERNCPDQSATARHGRKNVRDSPRERKRLAVEMENENDVARHAEKRTERTRFTFHKPRSTDSGEMCSFFKYEL